MPRTLEEIDADIAKFREALDELIGVSGSVSLDRVCDGWCMDPNDSPCFIS